MLANTVALSAITGEGTDKLFALIDADLDRRRQPSIVHVPIDDGETIAWLYRAGRSPR